MELQTIANQYLKPERILEYLEILKKRDSGDYEKSATFFKYVIVTRYLCPTINVKANYNALTFSGQNISN